MRLPAGPLTRTDATVRAACRALSANLGLADGGLGARFRLQHPDVSGQSGPNRFVVRRFVVRRFVVRRFVVRKLVVRKLEVRKVVVRQLE